MEFSERLDARPDLAGLAELDASHVVAALQIDPEQRVDVPQPRHGFSLRESLEEDLGDKRTGGVAEMRVLNTFIS